MNEPKTIEPLILILRGQRVILDADLAQVYGVPTKRLNEQMKRNAARFPDDFVFQPTPKEWKNLKSQFATSSLEAVENEDPNRRKWRAPFMAGAAPFHTHSQSMVPLWPPWC
ncbi:MAG: hypothetical protein DRP64_02690 [Verrucomicrobia bacterium]|nr:MAG: hypothetical protein DRP64_02690 [Verrucomicrobiota bacterium]